MVRDPYTADGALSGLVGDNLSEMKIAKGFWGWGIIHTQLYQNPVSLSTVTGHLSVHVCESVPVSAVCCQSLGVFWVPHWSLRTPPVHTLENSVSALMPDINQERGETPPVHAVHSADSPSLFPYTRINSR